MRQTTADLTSGVYVCHSTTQRTDRCQQHGRHSRTPLADEACIAASGMASWVLAQSATH